MQFRDPEFEAGLIRRLLANPIGLVQLSPEERQYLLENKLQTPCPVCQKPFFIYDRHHNRIRCYCSVVCSNHAKAKRPLKWGCILCPRRFKNSTGLQLHLKRKHPECDEHEYLRLYFKSKGRDPSGLSRFCPVCGKETTLDFGKLHYKTCHCVNAEKKLHRIEQALAAETDEAAKRHLSNQIRGLKGKLTVLRSPPHKRNTHVTRVQPATSQAPMEIISCDWMEGLVALGQEYAAVRDQHLEVYQAYYRMLEVVKLHEQNLNVSEVTEANDRLLAVIKAHDWTVSGNGLDCACLYVIALHPYNRQLEGPEYRFRTGFDLAAYMKLVGGMKYDAETLKQFLLTNPGHFPLIPNPKYQCWHRVVVPSNDQWPHKLSPAVYFEVYKATHEEG